MLLSYQVELNLLRYLPDNLCLDPKDLIKKVNKKTKAVIYVTLNGRSGHITEIQKICKNKKINLIEDSAHSLGSFYKTNIMEILV